MVVNVPSVAVNVTLPFEDTLPSSVRFPVDEMERSPFPAFAELTMSGRVIVKEQAVSSGRRQSQSAGRGGFQGAAGCADPVRLPSA